MNERDEMEQLIKDALNTLEEPSSLLNQKVLKKAKERIEVKKGHTKMLPAAAILILILCIGGGTAYAAWNYLHPSQVAQEMGSKNLAKLFDSERAVEINETQTFEDYTVTLLGIADSKGIDYMEVEVSLEKDRLYTVVAIQKTDGTPMPEPDKVEEDELDFLTLLLFQGENPAIINAWSMNLSLSSIKSVKDGVLYCISSCDELETFTEKEVYLAILKDSFYDASAYNYEEESGVITQNEAYKGVNALFSLPINKENMKIEENLYSSQKSEETTSINKEKEKRTGTLSTWSEIIDKKEIVYPYMAEVFDKQICVVTKEEEKNSYQLNFFTREGKKKLGEIEIPLLEGKNTCSISYVEGYLVWKEESIGNGIGSTRYTICNEQYEICNTFTLPDMKDVEWNTSDSGSVVLPKEKKLLYWNHAEDTDGFYFEICRCSYDGSKKEQLYKIYTTEQNSAKKVIDISSATLSQDGKTLFFVPLYMDVIESGATSKTGAGIMNVESGEISFEPLAVDSIVQVTEKQALFVNNAGVNNEVTVMDFEGNYQSIAIENTSEQLDATLSNDGKKVFTVMDVYKEKKEEIAYQILKCYDVETGELQWKKKLPKGQAVCSTVGLEEGKEGIVVLYQRKTNQYVVKKFAAD